MKTWLSSGGGPLATCFTVYNDFFAYRSGIYHRASDAVAGGHYVCCVGYSNTDYQSNGVITQVYVAGAEPWRQERDSIVLS